MFEIIKDYKLYNVIFPVFMLTLFVPQLWLFSIISNLLIDGIVLLIISFIFYKRFNPKLFRKSFANSYFLGFLADFIGVIFMTTIFLMYEIFLIDLLWGKNIDDYLPRDPDSALIPFIEYDDDVFAIIFGILFIIVSLTLASELIFLI